MSSREVSPLAFPSDAELVMPGSKSEANRLLAAAALSPFAHELTGLPDALDVHYMVAGLCAMGYGVRALGSDGVVVAAERDEAHTSAEIFCGNAGTAARFLCAIAAVTPGDWTLTGDDYLARRPFRPLLDALGALGLHVDSADGATPLRVRGGRPTVDRVAVDASVSSQFATALMLIAPALERGLDVTFAGDVASRRYLDLTCTALRRAGALIGNPPRRRRPLCRSRRTTHERAWLLWTLKSSPAPLAPLTWTVSLSSPPSMRSLPSPLFQMSRSNPELPKTSSLPRSPRMVSLPLPPKMLSIPAAPCCCASWAPEVEVTEPSVLTVKVTAALTAL